MVEVFNYSSASSNFVYTEDANDVSVVNTPSYFQLTRTGTASGYSGHVKLKPTYIHAHWRWQYEVEFILESNSSVIGFGQITEQLLSPKKFFFQIKSGALSFWRNIDFKTAPFPTDVMGKTIKIVFTYDKFMMAAVAYIDGKAHHINWQAVQQGAHSNVMGTFGIHVVTGSTEIKKVRVVHRDLVGVPLYVGDSITFGSSILPYQKNYSRLKEGDVEYNQWASGSAAYIDMIKTIPAIVALNPSHVYVMLGTNDQAVANWQTNMAAFMDELLLHFDTTDVTIYSLPAQGTVDVSQSATDISNAVASKGFYYGDTYTATKSLTTNLYNAALFNDALHTNQAGHISISQVTPTILPPPNTDPYWANVISLMHFDAFNGLGKLIDEKGHTWGTSEGGWAIPTLNTVSKKFGASSMEGSVFSDGTWPALQFGLGDFTVEFWTRIPTVAENWKVSYDSRYNGTGFAVVNYPSGVVYFLDDNGWKTITSTVADQDFHHVAIVRSSGTLLLFWDGILGSSTTNTINYTSLNLNLNFAVDELRVTYPIARYTSNFTPPPSPFPNN